jgi:hypothetical protein
MKNNRKGEKIPQKIYFSETQNTIDKWTGYGGYYQIKWQIELFGFMLVIWKKGKT